MKSHKTSLVVAFAICLLACSVLTIVFWPAMTDTILLPIYYILWLCSLIINRIPQNIYLAFLVILSIVVGVRTLGKLSSIGARQPEIDEQPYTNTRYQHWRTLISFAHGTWFSKNRLASEACELMLSILAFEQGTGYPEIEGMVRDGALDIPKMLQDVIILKHIPDTPSKRLLRMLRWMGHPAQWKNTSSDQYVDQFLTELINFVEHHLEITSHAGNDFES